MSPCKRRRNTGSFVSAMLAVPAVVKALPTTAPKTGTALAANVYAYANDVCQNDAAYSSLEGYSGADSYCRSMLPSLDLAVMVPVTSTVTAALATTTKTVTTAPTMTMILDSDYVLTSTITASCVPTSAPNQIDPTPGRPVRPALQRVRRSDSVPTLSTFATADPTIMTGYQPAQVTSACSCYMRAHPRTTTSAVATVTEQVSLLNKAYTVMAGEPVISTQYLGQTRTMTQTVCVV